SAPTQRRLSRGAWKTPSIPRQLQPRYGAAVGRVREARAPVMQLGDFQYERQAEPGAFLPRMRPRERVELLEHLVLRIVGNAGAAIADGQLHAVGARVQGNVDRSAVGREVDGIVEQVDDGTAQQECLALDLRRVPGRQHERDAPPARGRLRRLQRLLDQPAHIHRLDAFEPPARLERRQFEQPVDQFLDALRFARDVGDEALALRLRHLFLQQLARPADSRERALYLVRERLYVLR